MFLVAIPVVVDLLLRQVRMEVEKAFNAVAIPVVVDLLLRPVDEVDRTGRRRTAVAIPVVVDLLLRPEFIDRAGAYLYA